jgi:hypothetical protein
LRTRCSSYARWIILPARHDVLKEVQRSCEYRRSKEISEEDVKFAIQEILHQSLLHLPSLGSMQGLPGKSIHKLCPQFLIFPKLFCQAKRFLCLSRPFKWERATVHKLLLRSTHLSPPFNFAKT